MSPARSIGYTLRHDPPAAYVLGLLVDLRLLELNGWMASADAPDGPSLGTGLGAIQAIEGALEPFDGVVDELTASLSDSAS